VSRRDSISHDNVEQSQSRDRLSSRSNDGSESLSHSRPSRAVRWLHDVERTAPLAPPAVGLMTGVALDAHMEVSPAVSLLIFACVAGLAFVASIRRSYGVVLVGVAAVAIGSLMYYNSVRRVPADGIQRYATDLGGIARIRGVVASVPRLLESTDFEFAKWSYGGERTVFLLDAESVEGTRGDIAVSGRIRVTVGEAVLDLRRGERVEIFGKMYALRPPANPGSYDWSLRNRRQGIVAGMSCDHALNVRRLDRSPPPLASTAARVSKLLDRFRNRARDLLLEDLLVDDEDEASLLQAMVLGRRSALSKRISDAFIRTGCAHFLAVSGAHLAVLVFFAVLIGRVLVITRRRFTCVLIICVVIYAAVAEFRYPILRATITAMVFYVGVLAGRRTGLLNAISAVAILFILLRPAAVFDVSFQLSFAATTGIVCVTPALIATEAAIWLRVRYSRRLRHRDPSGEVLSRLHRFTLLNRIRLHVRPWLVTPLTISAGAWLATAPIVACQFHRFQPWGFINSIAVLLFGSAVVVVGILTLIVSAVSPTLAIPLKWVLSTLDGLLISMVNHLAQVPYTSIAVPPVPWWLMALFYVCLFVYVWRFRGASSYEWDSADRLVRRRPRSTQRSGVLLALSLIVSFIGIVVWINSYDPKPRLVITTLAVGRGTTTVIELPDGRTFLYDAGTDRPFDVGTRVIAPFLQSRGKTRVDRVYISHSNLDHYSGVPGLIRALGWTGEPSRVGPIVVTPYFERFCSDRSPGRYFLDLLRRRSHPVEVIDLDRRRWTEGDVTFDLLWPIEGNDSSLRPNDTSTALRLTYQGSSILLTGDIEDAAQLGLLAKGDLAADVLMLPHHGSVRNSSEDFIDAVNPRYVIRSHRERTVETRSALPMIVGDRPMFNTADVGAIEVVIDENGVSVRACRD